MSREQTGSENGTTGNETVDFHNLSEEELSKIEVDETEEQDSPGETSKTDESDKPTTKDEAAGGKDDSTTEGDEPKTGEAAPEEGTTGDAVGEEEKKGDPLKDTQAAFHRKATELSNAKRQIAELEKRIRELEEPHKPDGIDLTEEELEELRFDDPDEYIRIKSAKSEYDRKKEQYDQTVEDAEKREMEIRQELAMQKTVDSVVEFFTGFLGIEGGLPGEDYARQPKEIQDAYQSEPFQKVIAEIEANPKRFYEEDGSISAKTLEMVYKNVHFDALAGKERINGRREAVKKIGEAASSGSPLDKVPKEEAGSKRGSGKSIDQLSQADIHSMSKEELDSYAAEFGIDEEDEE